MNLMITKLMFWQGRTLNPGTIVQVHDRLLALALLGSQRAVAADPETAAMLDVDTSAGPAARSGAVPIRKHWRR